MKETKTDWESFSLIFEEQAIRVRKVHTENFRASLLSLMVGAAVSSCALTGLRAVAPSNAPPTFSGRWQPADGALPHQGIAIDGRGYFDYEILVQRSRGRCPH